MIVTRLSFLGHGRSLIALMVLFLRLSDDMSGTAAQAKNI
jgi:hypothetical protein